MLAPLLFAYKVENCACTSIFDAQRGNEGRAGTLQGPVGGPGSIYN